MKKAAKPKSTGKRLAAAGIISAVSALLLVLARNVSGFADIYAQHVYPIYAGCIGGLCGLFSFPVAELILYALVIWLICSFVMLCVKLLRSRDRVASVLAWLCRLALLASVLFFLYTLGCGINYQRSSFSEEADIPRVAYTNEDLMDTCRWLTERVNAYAGIVERDDTGLLIISDEAAEAVYAMKSLALRYPCLEASYAAPKALIFSEFLSWQKLSGVFSPFTIEANYNGDMVSYNRAFCACHELSHESGFMREDEANFIAFLACLESSVPEFIYSGYLTCWIYCTNALYSADTAAYQEIRMNLDAGALSDLAANNAFWEQFEGPVADVSESLNDAHLKAQGQTEGTASYGRMVDLVVSSYITGLL